MNIKKLRCVMVMNDDTTQGLAKTLGITVKALRDKIRGRSEFKQSELQTIINKYGLTEKQTFEIFGFGNNDEH